MEQAYQQGIFAAIGSGCNRSLPVADKVRQRIQRITDGTINATLPIHSAIIIQRQRDNDDKLFPRQTQQSRGRNSGDFPFMTVDQQFELGVSHHQAGRLFEAEHAYRQILTQQPDHSETLRMLAILASQLGRRDAAMELMQRVVQLKPDWANAHYDLGITLHRNNQPIEAIAAARQAIRLKPDFAEAYSVLGAALLRIGQLDEAVACYRRAIELRPDFVVAHSGLIYALHFHPDFDAEKISLELRRWNQAHAEPLKKQIQPCGNTREPDRRLRIGYVPPHFSGHVVGRCLLPLFREHEHEQFEIVCYSNSFKVNGMTQDFQEQSDLWRNIASLSDWQTAELIRSDRVDILVDLTLHMPANRLGVFALKPAPVQVTYLGYCSSTGLETMDYRLSDVHLDPPDSDLSVYSEQTIRLPETYWCYNPGGPAPEPSPAPALAAGYITFGCLNNFAKVSPALDLWAEILISVPRSRLILHSDPGMHLDALHDRFARKGISPDRLEFQGKYPWPKYIQSYDRIDIALDPFPWGGGITTFDALWMGVPVVSLVGRTAVGRGGTSILRNLGLPELIARTPEQYVKIATNLARDMPRLAELRRTLRARMKASPLMDAPRFARNVEAAYRQMWRNWCESVGQPRG